MNNKGFTLVEVLATVALLAIISTISFVSINTIIKNNKVSNCESLVSSIKSAAKEYVSDNRYNSEFNLAKNNYVEFYATDLLNNNYLSGDIYDPFTDEVMNSNKIKIYVSLNDDYTPSKVDIRYNDEIYKCDGSPSSEIDNVAPVISVSVSDGETYAKSNTAKIILIDDGLGLVSGTYNLKYGWGTTNMNCSSLSEITSISVSEGDMLKDIEVSLSGYTGNGKIYVCNATDIVDIGGNVLKKDTVVSASMFLDNTGPIITVSDEYDWVIDFGEDLLVPLVVTDEYSGIDGDSFDKSGVSIKVGSDTLSSGFDLIKVDDNNYNLKIEKYSYDSNPAITIVENKVFDNAGNGNKETNLTPEVIFGNKFKISYNANGGTGSMSDTVCIYGENCSISSNIFTKEGYTFAGWTTNSNGIDDGYGWTNWNSVWNFDNGQRGIINNILNLYARWIPNKIVINYNVVGGVIASSTTTDDGVVYNWSTDSDGVIERNGITFSQTINYDDSLSEKGLMNYNNSKYIKITKDGYIAKSGEEWICLSGDCEDGKTYSQTEVYSSNDLCNAAKSDCNLVLGVNWIIEGTCYIINITQGVSCNSTPATIASGATRVIAIPYGWEVLVDKKSGSWSHSVKYNCWFWSDYSYEYTPDDGVCETIPEPSGIGNSSSGSTCPSGYTYATIPGTIDTKKYCIRDMTEEQYGNGGCASYESDAGCLTSSEDVCYCTLN